MRNDDTASAIAKKKQLQEQLAEAKKALETEQYDHSIEEQENALNKQYEQYEEERNAEIEALRASLEQKEQLIAESFEAVKQNANLIGQEIAAIATEHGVTVSNAIISSWNWSFLQFFPGNRVNPLQILRHQFVNLSVPYMH